MKPITRVASLSSVCLLALLATMTGPAAADGVAVVPGNTNGYFYDMSSNQTDSGKEISLVVKKEGHFKEYTIESADGALRCDQTCPETSQRLPAGSVSLKIIGKKPVSFLDIPLTGKWSEPCSNTTTETAECVFSLNELNGSVAVEVSPDIEVGTTLALPEGGEALIVNVNTREGYILLAGHEKLGESRSWLAFNPAWTSRLHINSPTDGRINSQKLLDVKPPSEAARYCAGLEGGSWYLPAERELALMTRSALQKIPGLNEGSYLWSSTEHKMTNTKNKKGEPYLELVVRVLNNGTAVIGNKATYSYDQKKDGSWVEDKPYSNRYQVLCFRRLAF